MDNNEYMPTDEEWAAYWQSVVKEQPPPKKGKTTTTTATKPLPKVEKPVEVGGGDILAYFVLAIGCIIIWNALFGKRRQSIPPNKGMTVTYRKQIGGVTWFDSQEDFAKS